MSRVVTFGEIMVRLATPGFARFRQAMPGTVNLTFAGAEASIAASLACLGVEAAFATALPDHVIADACISNLAGIGVETRHILRTSAGRLGIYYLEHGVNQRSGNVIYDRDGSAVSVTPPEAYDWDAMFSGCEWFVISGITAAISRLGAEVALHAVKEAARRGIKVVFDINYRTKLWQWEPSLSAPELACRTLRTLMPYVALFVGGVSDALLILGSEMAGKDPGSLARMLRASFPDWSRWRLPFVMAAPLLSRSSGASFTKPPRRPCIIRHSTPSRMLWTDLGRGTLSPQASFSRCYKAFAPQMRLPLLLRQDAWLIPRRVTTTTARGRRSKL